MSRFLGIDFSGNHLMWRPACGRSNVWISDVRRVGATFLRQYRSFSKARSWVRSLGLKSRAEWKAFCKSGKLPKDIPSNPNRTYAERGWKGMGDWLGTGTIAWFLREYRLFPKARSWARSLRLKSGTEWKAYCKSGKLPKDIPAIPEQTYPERGWKGMGNWLGTGTVALRFREYRSFPKARSLIPTSSLALALMSAYLYLRSGWRQDRLQWEL